MTLPRAPSLAAPSTPEAKAWRRPRPPRCVACVLSVLFLSGSTPTCDRTRTLPPCDASPNLPKPLHDPAKAVVVAAGDIAQCARDDSWATAALVEQQSPDAVLTLGDTAYPNGSLDDFLDCYHPRWGRYRSITRAAVGNHEYHAPHAGPFFAYFCGATGHPFEGWTSFDLGAWHIIVLNSNCGSDLDLPGSVSSEFGGCEADSRQAQWLRADLRAHPSLCTLALWHHPRFSSGGHGSAEFMEAIWSILHEAGVDVVLSGHAHVYERFAPMGPKGQRDDTRGLRQFVVGTGGAPLHAWGTLAPGSEARNNGVHGILRLELMEGSYTWRFVPTRTSAFIDEGAAPCHD